MTTIVVVRKNGVAAIAADTLTTFGNTRLPSHLDASHDKILHLGNSYVGICGSAAHHLVLANLFAKMPEVKLNSKAEIFETFRKLHPILKEECFLNPKEDEEDPYESSQITALIANTNGIFGVYSMREVFEFDRFWAIGSGRDFALGAMYAVYAKAKSAAAIAETGVMAGAEFDTGTSAPVLLHEVRIRA